MLSCICLTSLTCVAPLKHTCSVCLSTCACCLSYILTHTHSYIHTYIYIYIYINMYICIDGLISFVWLLSCFLELLALMPLLGAPCLRCLYLVLLDCWFVHLLAPWTLNIDLMSLELVESGCMYYCHYCPLYLSCVLLPWLLCMCLLSLFTVMPVVPWSVSLFAGTFTCIYACCLHMYLLVILCVRSLSWPWTC